MGNEGAKRERANRTWVAIADTNNYEIGRFVQFNLPEQLPNGTKISNTKAEATWFYLNALDSFSTISYERVLNADDIVPNEIISHIPIKKPYWEDK